MRSATPGSLRWLVGKQVLWQWRGMTSGQRTGLIVSLVVVALVTLAFYAGLRGVIAELHLDLNAPLPPKVYPWVLLGQTFFLTLMVSAAVTAALEVLFTRGDLDLLLHSPVSPRTVLASRALGVTISAALAAALLLVPLLLLLLVLGAWRGLGLLVWWGGTSLFAASLGLWLTLGLVRALGVRRTRTVASVIGALFGGAIFLASQWHNFSRGTPNASMEWLSKIAPGVGFLPAAESPLWYPVRSAWLEPWPTLALLGVSALFFGLTVSALTRQFTQGAQEAAEAGVRRSAKPAAQTLRFASGSRATLLKEWRLLLRDPELLSRTLLQVVYLLPLMFSVGRASVYGAVGGGVVLLTANLASSLARITLDAEDAPDLLVCAPRSPAALRREKWLAAVIPTALLGLLAWLVMAARGLLHSAFLGGLPLLPLILLGTGGAALMVLWQPLPVRRADAFKSRQGQSFGQVILSLLFQFPLSFTAYAASAGQWWGVLPLAIALIVLAVAYSGRRSDVE